MLNCIIYILTTNYKKYLINLYNKLYSIWYINIYDYLKFEKLSNYKKIKIVWSK